MTAGDRRKPRHERRPVDTTYPPRHERPARPRRSIRLLANRWRAWRLRREVTS